MKRIGYFRKTKRIGYMRVKSLKELKKNGGDLDKSQG
jgi:pimeloyl-CoA synthetase